MDREHLESTLISIRHHLHQYPELSLQEFNTTTFIQEKLQEVGIQVEDTAMKTGVFATINERNKGPVVAIRADIDALPIEEQTGLPYASHIKGIMHACGHDFHTAAVIGAAYLLEKDKGNLDGAIRLIFQPAEEAGGGAELVINDGQLKDVDYIIGLHNKPDLPVGTIGLKNGAIMAAVDRFKIELHGVGSHAGIPNVGRDPIVASAHLITALQTIVSRNVSPLQSAVVSVTKIIGGNTWNVLPEKVILEGTFRTFHEQSRTEVKRRFNRIVEQISDAFELKSSVHWQEGPPALINDPTIIESLTETATKQSLQIINPEPSMGGEDFSHYLEHIKGAFVFFGTNGTEDWHHPAFTVDDSALIYAAYYLYESAKDLLVKLTK